MFRWVAAFLLVAGSAFAQTAVQRLEVVGPDGRACQALYDMIQGTDGMWRVDACVLTESEAVGA